MQAEQKKITEEQFDGNKMRRWLVLLTAAGHMGVLFDQLSEDRGRRTLKRLSKAYELRNLLAQRKKEKWERTRFLIKSWLVLERFE